MGKVSQSVEDRKEEIIIGAIEAVGVSKENSLEGRVSYSKSGPWSREWLQQKRKEGGGRDCKPRVRRRAHSLLDLKRVARLSVKDKEELIRSLKLCRKKGSIGNVVKSKEGEDKVSLSAGSSLASVNKEEWKN